MVLVKIYISWGWLVCYSVLITSHGHTSGLDGKDAQSHSHALAHVILKTHVWYVACLKHCMVFPHLLKIQSYSTLSVMIMITKL